MLAAALIFLISATKLSSAAESPEGHVVDESRARSAGIRKLESKHLELYTDLPSDPEVDSLPALFDAAVPHWCKYFGVDPSKAADWRVRAFLIGDRRRFDALGLMPQGNDNFINGISVGKELWLHDQPTDYYRRHLLLHEGTHVFMFSLLGGCGPGWYMEGTAELMGTHRLKSDVAARASEPSPSGRGQGEGAPPNGKSPSPHPSPKGRGSDLELGVMPRDRTEVPMLGRVKLLRDAFAAKRALTFPNILRIDNREQLGNDSYAWCWAAAKFLDSHPRYRDRFRALQAHVTDRDFNSVVRRAYGNDWQDLLAEWMAFVATLDHGYDFERMAIEFRRGEPIEASSERVEVRADRGWQSSGVWLEAGKPYRITASGRYQVAEEQVDGITQSWPCEPGGVSIEYHDGRPLGMLLGAIDGRTAEGPATGANLAEPFAIGLGSTITPAASGTLYLRVNDSPAQLKDNRGTLTVRVERAR